MRPILRDVWKLERVVKMIKAFVLCILVEAKKAALRWEAPDG